MAAVSQEVRLIINLINEASPQLKQLQTQLKDLKRSLQDINRSRTFTMNRDLQSLSTTASKASGTFSKLRTTLTQVRGSFDNASRSTRSLSSSISDSSQKTNLFKARLESLNATLRTVDRNVSKVMYSSMRFASSFGSSIFRITSNALGSLNKALLNVQRSFITLQYASDAMVKAASGALIGMGAAAFIAGKAYEDTAEQISLASTMTNQSFEQLRKTVAEYSKTFGMSMSDVAKAAYMIGSAGIRDVTKFNKALLQTLVAASAGGADAAQTFQSAIGLVHAFGLSINNLASVYTLMFNAMKEGLLTFRDLTQYFGIIPPAARKLGVSLKGAIGAFTALTKMGLDPAEAAVATARAFDELLQKADKFHEIGIEIFDQYGRFRGLLPIMQDLANAMKEGLTPKELSDTVGLEIRAARAILNWSNNVDVLRDTLGKVNYDVKNVSDAFKKMMDSPARAIKRFSAFFEDQMLKLSEPVSKILNKLKPMVESTIDFIKDNAEGMFDLVLKFAPALLKIGVPLKMISMFAGDLYQVFFTMIHMLNPVVLLFGGLVATAIEFLTTHWGSYGGKVLNFFGELYNSISKVAQQIVIVISQANSLGDAFKGVLNIIDDFAVKALRQLFTWMAKAISGMNTSLISQALKTIKIPIKAMIEGIGIASHLEIPNDIKDVLARALMAATGGLIGAKLLNIKGVAGAKVAFGIALGIYLLDEWLNGSNIPTIGQSLYKSLLELMPSALFGYGLTGNLWGAYIGLVLHEVIMGIKSNTLGMKIRNLLVSALAGIGISLVAGPGVGAITASLVLWIIPKLFEKHDIKKRLLDMASDVAKYVSQQQPSISEATINVMKNQINELSQYANKLFADAKLSDQAVMQKYNAVQNSLKQLTDIVTSLEKIKSEGKNVSTNMLQAYKEAFDSVVAELTMQLSNSVDAIKNAEAVQKATGETLDKMKVSQATLNEMLDKYKKAIEGEMQAIGGIKKLEEIKKQYANQSDTAFISQLLNAIDQVIQAYSAFKNAGSLSEVLKAFQNLKDALSQYSKAYYQAFGTTPINTGYAAGGYTGKGDPDEIAGLVHKGEYVIPAWMVKKMPWLIAWLEKNRKKLKGFKEGGGDVASLISFAAKSTVNTIGGGVLDLINAMKKVTESTDGLSKIIKDFNDWLSGLGNDLRKTDNSAKEAAKALKDFEEAVKPIKDIARQIAPPTSRGSGLGFGLSVIDYMIKKQTTTIPSLGLSVMERLFTSIGIGRTTISEIVNTLSSLAGKKGAPSLIDKYIQGIVSNKTTMGFLGVNKSEIKNLGEAFKALAKMSGSLKEQAQALSTLAKLRGKIPNVLQAVGGAGRLEPFRMAGYMATSALMFTADIAKKGKAPAGAEEFVKAASLWNKTLSDNLDYFVSVIRAVKNLSSLSIKQSKEAKAIIEVIARQAERTKAPVLVSAAQLVDAMKSLSASDFANVVKYLEKFNLVTRQLGDSMLQSSGEIDLLAKDVASVMPLVRKEARDSVFNLFKELVKGTEFLSKKDAQLIFLQRLRAEMTEKVSKAEENYIPLIDKILSYTNDDIDATRSLIKLYIQYGGATTQLLRQYDNLINDAKLLAKESQRTGFNLEQVAALLNKGGLAIDIAGKMISDTSTKVSDTWNKLNSVLGNTDLDSYSTAVDLLYRQGVISSQVAQQMQQEIDYAKQVADAAMSYQYAKDHLSDFLKLFNNMPTQLKNNIVSMVKDSDNEFETWRKKIVAFTGDLSKASPEVIQLAQTIISLTHVSKYTKKKLQEWLKEQTTPNYMKKLYPGLEKKLSAWEINTQQFNTMLQPEIQARQGVGGLLSGNIGQFISAFASILNILPKGSELLQTIQQLMSPVFTILQGVAEVILPPLNEALQPFVKLLLVLGRALGTILLPVLKPLIYLLNLFAEALIWLYNKVLRPILRIIYVMVQPMMYIFKALYDALHGNFSAAWNDLKKATNLGDLWKESGEKIGTIGSGATSTTTPEGTYTATVNRTGPEEVNVYVTIQNSVVQYPEEKWKEMVIEAVKEAFDNGTLVIS